MLSRPAATTARGGSDEMLIEMCRSFNLGWKLPQAKSIATTSAPSPKPGCDSMETRGSDPDECAILVSANARNCYR
jgi:hypothetical protein